jgi:hypothetical protein
MDKLLSRASALVGLGPACTPTITFSDEAQRKKINVIKEGQAESLLVFTDKDPVAGEVTLKLDPGKRLEHLGVKIEFIGMIEMFYGNYHEFSNLVRDLDAPGELTATKTYPFDFSTVDKQVGRASRRARISGTHASAGLGGSVSARWCSLIAKARTDGQLAGARCVRCGGGSAVLCIRSAHARPRAHVFRQAGPLAVTSASRGRMLA